MPPPIIKLTPPFVATTTPIATPLSSPGAVINSVEKVNANGNFRFISGLSVNGACNNDWASLSQHAYCVTRFISNGKSPLNITARYRPATIKYSGFVVDETGVSSVGIHWRLQPTGFARILPNGGMSRLTHAPARVLSFDDINSASHSWGPTTKPAGARPTRSMTFTYNNFRIAAGTSVELFIGLHFSHWFVSNDVTLLSSADVNFNLSDIFIRAT